MSTGVEIRTARESDLPALRGLWDLCFPGGAAYDRYLFGGVIRPERCLLAVSGGRPAAMLHILPATLRTPEGDAACAYVYGVGTHPALRGRGLAALLFGRLHALLENGGLHALFGGRAVVCSALIPADPPLFAFYERFGYRAVFYAERRDVPLPVPAPPSGFTVRALGADDLAALDALYRDAMAGRAHLLRGADWGMLLGYCRAGGGEALGAFSGRELRSYAFGAAENGVLTLDECVARDPGALGALLAAFSRRFPSRCLRYAAPARTLSGAQPIGCLRGSVPGAPLFGDAPPPYINLLFNEAF